MGITLAHTIDPYLLGEAAYTAGVGEFSQKEAERQRQLANQDRDFELQERRLALSNDLERARFGQDQFEFQQRMIDAENARQAQMAAEAMRLQYGGWETQYKGELDRMLQGDRLGAGLIEQQMMGREEQFKGASQFHKELELQRQKEVAKQRSADINALLRARNSMDESQWQQAWDSLNQKYESLGVPDPLIGTEVLDEDPELAALQNRFPSGAFSRDSKGKLYSVIPPQYLPEYREEEHQRELQLEDRRNANKTIQAQQKAQQEAEVAEQNLQYKAAGQQVDLEYKQQNANIDAIASAIERKASVQAKIADLQAKIAELKSRTVKDAEGNATPANIDTSAMQSAVTELQSILESITVPGQYVPPSQQMQQTMNAATGAMPTQPVGQGFRIIGPNTLGYYGRLYPDGTVDPIR